jgi:hypothetical protein
MERCGNVRSEKLMLTALRGRRVRNMPKWREEGGASLGKSSIVVII